VYERYLDSDALLEHVANLGDLMGAMMALTSISGEVLGTPSPKLKKMLEWAEVLVYTPYLSM
jgi:hypothetical protein